MSRIDVGESDSVANEENLSKTFETTAETLFGSITDNNIENSNSIENKSDRKNIENLKNENNDENNEIKENTNENIGENKENTDENIGANEEENTEENKDDDVDKKNATDNIREYKERSDENKENINESIEENIDGNIADGKNQDSDKNDSKEMKKCNIMHDQKAKAESSLLKKSKDINSIAQQIIDGKKDPLSVEFDDTLPILTYITHYRNEKMASYEVNEAERSDAIISTIIHNYRSTLKSINRVKKEEFIKNKLQKAEKKLRQAENQTKQSMSELKAQNDQSLRELKTVQSQEVDDLINKFNSPVIQRHYTQASPQLRTLRFQMQLLQQSKRFDELRITQKRVETEEKLEIEKVTRSMASQLQSQMKLLEEKHRGEIESRQIAFEDRETKMRRKCNSETEAIRNHINNINADLRMLQSKQTESSQNIMQNGELMLKITKAAAIKKSRPSTSIQKKKAISKNDRFYERDGELKPLSRSLGATDIFSLKLPPLIKSKGVKEKREKMLEKYKV